MGAAGENLSSLLNVLGLHRECIMTDAHHCVDMGIASHAVGNIIWEIVQSKYFGPDQNQHENIKLHDAARQPWESTNRIELSTI